jgi:hypothetical protein
MLALNSEWTPMADLQPRNSPRSDHGALVLGLFLVVALSLHFWHHQDLTVPVQGRRIDNPMALYNSKACGSSVDDVSKASINLMRNVVRPTPSTWRVQTMSPWHSICNRVLMCYTNEPKKTGNIRASYFPLAIFSAGSFQSGKRWQNIKIVGIYCHILQSVQTIEQEYHEHEIVTNDYARLREEQIFVSFSKNVWEKAQVTCADQKSWLSTLSYD